MSPHRTEQLEHLITEADTGLERILRRMKTAVERAGSEDTSWELEEAFGVPDPVKAERQLQEEETKAAKAPVEDRPTRGQGWRDLFRRNWPDGPRRTRGRTR